MSSGAEPGPPRAAVPVVSPLRVVAGVCIVAPFVAVLWIPSYNKATPTVLGFPFFYWYQLLWVVITAVLMVIAYFAVTRDNAARRAAGRTATKSTATDSTGTDTGTSTSTDGGEAR